MRTADTSKEDAPLYRKAMLVTLPSGCSLSFSYIATRLHPLPTPVDVISTVDRPLVCSQNTE